MIKAVLFDFGQTLANSADGFRVAEKEIQTKIFRDLTLPSWEKFLANYRKIRQEFQASFSFFRKAIWQKVYSHYDREPEMRLLEEWESDYWKIVKDQTTLFPETERTLRNLLLEYQLALITNAQQQNNSDNHRLGQFPKLKRFFPVTVMAGEFGVPSKPDRTPFLLCLESLGIAPSEAIYVGDDWHIDICGARNVGIQPVWLQHHLVRRSWPTANTSVPVITSLDQLLYPKSILF